MKRFLLGTLAALFIFVGYSQEFSFEYDGIERTYIIHLPPEYNSDMEYPLVINMHGLGSNAVEQQFYSDFNKVADTAGIVVVYPNGVNNLWNISSDNGIDDVGFISALIDTIASNYSLDLLRVYSTGMSMGGFMSYRLACQLDDRIAAIASVTGTLAYPNCNNERPFPVLQIHGTADETVPYALVPPLMDLWVSKNNCIDSVSIDLPDIDTTDQCTVVKTIYSPCDDDVEVILYTILGGEHTWPGAPIAIGVTNYDINASVEIWNFFTQYTLPEFVGTDEDVDDPDELLVFPQPALSRITIQLPGENQQQAEVRMYDLSGHLLNLKHQSSGNTITIDRNGLKSGFYVLEVSFAGTTYREKVIFK